MQFYNSKTTCNLGHKIKHKLFPSLVNTPDYKKSLNNRSCVFSKTTPTKHCTTTLSLPRAIFMSLFIEIYWISQP